MFQVASRTYNMCLTLTQPDNDQPPVSLIYGIYVPMVIDIADIEKRSREFDWTYMLY